MYGVLYAASPEVFPATGKPRDTGNGLACNRDAELAAHHISIDP
jgi:hypothetical protein